MRKWPYIFVMVALSSLYIFLQEKFPSETIGGTVTVVLAIIAAVAFWLEFRSSERLNEAKFIMDLNNQFISNPELTKVEYILEQYYKAYAATESEEERKKLSLGEKFDMDGKDRQSIVNYLVHLEGIATLVNSRVLHLNVIDDLMTYRYFIANTKQLIESLVDRVIIYEDYIQIKFTFAKTKDYNFDPPTKEELVENGQKNNLDVTDVTPRCGGEGGI